MISPLDLDYKVIKFQQIFILTKLATATLYRVDQLTKQQTT